MENTSRKFGEGNKTQGNIIYTLFRDSGWEPNEL